jgi:hypothetical protein
MEENNRNQSTEGYKESPAEPENVPDTKNQHPDPYPNQEAKEGADNEEYIINNANSNGINPNPVESGNNPEWIDGRKQTESYIHDATNK